MTATLKMAHGQGLPLTRLPHLAKALCSCSACVFAAVALACSRAETPAFAA